MMPRYEARTEADGSWTVYDRLTGLPALVNDIAQTGHAEADAHQVARELDDIMGEDDAEAGP